MKFKHIFLISALVIISLIMTAMPASAADGSSYTDCSGRTTYRTKNIVRNGATVGTLRVFNCSNGHFFAQVNNATGSKASGTYVSIRRNSSREAVYRIMYPQISGRFQSVTYLLRNPSNTQCFQAFGRVDFNSSTLRASTTIDWCA